jgi:hypothetical protein
MQCSGCYEEVAPYEFYVDDRGLVQYHLKCFNRLVVPVIIDLITLARQGHTPCSSEPLLQLITVPVAAVA